MRPGEDLRLGPHRGSTSASELRDPSSTSSGEFHVLQFPHGAANLTYLIALRTTPSWCSGDPPFGTLAPGAHDMRPRVQGALPCCGSIFDKAPTRLPVLRRPRRRRRRHVRDGAAAYGEVIRGDRAAVGMRHHTRRRSPSWGSRWPMPWRSSISSNPRPVGLNDLGRPDGFVARQVGGLEEALGPRRRPRAVRRRVMADLHSLARGRATRIRSGSRSCTTISSSTIA